MKESVRVDQYNNKNEIYGIKKNLKWVGISSKDSLTNKNKRDP